MEWTHVRACSYARGVPLPQGDQTSYYPSAKVVLHIRLEEYGAPLSGKPPTKSILRVKGVEDDGRSIIQVNADPSAPSGIRRFILDAIPKSSSFSPDATSADNRTFHVTMIPQNATWKQNPHKTADELEFTMRADDFPFDPRILRSIAVEYFLGTIQPEDYAGGIAGLVQHDRGESRPLYVVPDSTLDRYGQRRTNLRFQGWVQKYSRKWAKDGSKVTLKCADNSSLLINNVAAPTGSIDSKKPIDEAIAGYLSLYPQFRGLSVEYRGPVGEIPPVLSDVLSATAYRPNWGPPVSKGAGGGGEKFSVMDYLTEVCGTVGLLVRIVNSTIVIQKPSNLFGDQVSPRVDDPYQKRVIDGVTYDIRSLVWGSNVTDMDAEREYTRNEPKNIEMRCYDVNTKQTLVARFPLDKKDRIVSVQPGDGGEENKWTVKEVTGIKSQVMLNEVARQTYQQQCRKELEFGLKTKNLATFGGDNEDPDLLDMQIGDVVNVLIALTEQKTVGNDKSYTDFLVGLGYPQAMADAVALAQTNANFPRQYKVREVSSTWDIKDGVAFDLKVVDFVVARLDQQALDAAPTPPRPGTNVPVKAPAQISPTSTSVPPLLRQPTSQNADGSFNFD